MVGGRSSTGGSFCALLLVCARPPGSAPTPQLSTSLAREKPATRTAHRSCASRRRSRLSDTSPTLGSTSPVPDIARRFAPATTISNFNPSTSHVWRVFFCVPTSAFVLGRRMTEAPAAAPEPVLSHRELSARLSSRPFLTQVGGGMRSGGLLSLPSFLRENAQFSSNVGLARMALGGLSPSALFLPCFRPLSFSALPYPLTFLFRLIDRRFFDWRCDVWVAGVGAVLQLLATVRHLHSVFIGVSHFGVHFDGAVPSQ